MAEEYPRALLPAYPGEAAPSARYLRLNPNPDREGVTRFARTSVIYETYQNARARGDRHVYFVDGAELYGDSDQDSCTVDFLHPNDLGFMRMARRLRPAVGQALREAE